MRKELIVSSSPHEMKIAVLEDNQVVEVYFEREKEYSLAGSIYKGRVMRVLPGMQSAFVNIGLERDAFLYVSDFLEEIEEYDKLVSTADRKAAADEKAQAPVIVVPAAEPETARKEETPEPAEAAQREPVPPEAAPQQEARPAETRAPEARPAEETPRGREAKERGRRGSRRPRRRRGQRREFPESKYARPGEPPAAPAPPTPIILPGESLAKYKDWTGEAVSDELPPAESASAEPAVEEETRKLSAETEPAEPDEPAAEAVIEERERQALDAAAQSDNWVVSVAEPDPEEPEPEEPIAWGARRRDAAEEIKEAEERAEPLSAAAAGFGTTPAAAGDEENRQAPAAEELAAAETFEPEAATRVTPETDTDSVADSEEEELREGAGEMTEAEEEDKQPEALLREEAAPAENGQEKPEREEATRPSDQRAAVREGSRHPRYTRRARWLERRQTRGPRQEPRPRERETPKPMIADLLKEGQEIIVQIAKEPIGTKGARITSHITLPGRYLVYMPTLDHTGVSRKIASDEERQRLKRIILEHTRDIPGGFIVRTAGEGRSEEDFRQDIAYLAKLWSEIKNKAESVKAPALLHHDVNVVMRTLRDQLSQDFTAVWVDNEQEYEKILDLASRFQPSLLPRIKLYTKDVPVFEELGIQEEINKALKSKVWLKSGGYIVINQTEALVAVDINTGKFVGKSNRLEDTIVKTNIDAIQEIVRQIRLRDMGGIIVIDFIDMDERRNRQKVMGALEEALKGDRAPSKILSFNEFGLVAITRKRVRQSLERTLCLPCPDCGGSGFVKSPSTISTEILNEARKLSREWGDKQVTLRVHPEVAKALKARESTVLQEIEQISGKAVIIRSDPTLHMESFDFN